MLKRASGESRDDGWDDYHSVRDRAVVVIRKRKRDDIFNQRRNQRLVTYEEALSEDVEF